MHLELFLVRVLIPCTPAVGVLSFLYPRTPAVFLREEYARYVTPCSILVVPIISFPPLANGLAFLLFV
jgi:hypothetical protein